MLLLIVRATDRSRSEDRQFSASIWTLKADRSVVDTFPNGPLKSHRLRLGTHHRDQGMVFTFLFNRLLCIWNTSPSHLRSSLNLTTHSIMWKLLLIPRSPIHFSVPIKSSSQESRQPTKHPQKFPFTDYDIPHLCNWLLPEYYQLRSKGFPPPTACQPGFQAQTKHSSIYWDLVLICRAERDTIFFFLQPNARKAPAASYILRAGEQDRSSAPETIHRRPILDGEKIREGKWSPWHLSPLLFFIVLHKLGFALCRLRGWDWYPRGGFVMVWVGSSRWMDKSGIFIFRLDWGMEKGVHTYWIKIKEFGNKAFSTMDDHYWRMLVLRLLFTWNSIKANLLFLLTFSPSLLLTCDLVHRLSALPWLYFIPKTQVCSYIQI